jgi:hypothetical protein
LVGTGESGCTPCNSIGPGFAQALHCDWRSRVCTKGGRMPVGRTRSRGLTEHVMFRGLSIVATYLFAAALLGIFGGWLTSLNAKPLRLFREHPWRIFWLLGVPLFAAILVAINLAPVIESDTTLSRPSRMLTGAVVWSAILVLSLGAIQGLRVTWLRSRSIAIVILSLWLIGSAIQVFAEFATFGPSPHAVDTFWTGVSLTPSWVLAAWLCHKISSRLSAGRIAEVI